MKNGFILFCFIFLGNSTYLLNAQLVSNKPTKYCVLNYSNDVWQKTDRYLTQSLSIEYVNPILKLSPLNKILIKGNYKNPFETGIRIMQNVYTPTSINQKDIQVNNHPYSATLTLTQFYNQINDTQKYTIHSEIQLGVLGPSALGKEMQTGVHKAIKDNLPQGWDNQLRNSLILNYNIQYTKSVLSKAYYELSPFGALRMGTLNNDISIGLKASIGNKPSVYKISHRKIEFNFTYLSEIRQVFYNAVLEGSFFRKSSYQLLPSQISSLVYQNEVQYNMRIKNFKFAFSQIWLSKVYKAGLGHTYNTITLGSYF